MTRCLSAITLPPNWEDTRLKHNGTQPHENAALVEAYERIQPTPLREPHISRGLFQDNRHSVVEGNIQAEPSISIRLGRHQASLYWQGHILHGHRFIPEIVLAW